MLISKFPTDLKMSGKKKEKTNIESYERYVWANVFLR